MFSISVTAAHQDIHIEICPSLLIHPEMSLCTATDVSAVAPTCPCDTASWAEQHKWGNHPSLRPGQRQQTSRHVH